MVFFKSFKILILCAAILLSQDLLANAQCSALFGEKAEFTKAPQTITSRIQSEEWLTKKLFEEGWLEKIRIANHEKDHIELYSEMLYETTQLLLREFYGKDSKLNKMRGAESYLRGIVRDIKAHRTEQKVTKKYFLEINAVIATYISMKHESDTAGKYLKDLLGENLSPQQIDSIIRSGREDFSTLEMREILTKDVVLIPTFVELSIESFIKMGIIEGKVFPIGMTLEAYVQYDGMKKTSAKEYFTHDLLHARQIARAIAILVPNKNFKEVMRKASDRYLEYRDTLGIKTHKLMDVILFGFSHEQELSAFYEFLRPNGKPSWSSTNNSLYRETLLETMTYFIRRDLNYTQKEISDKELQVLIQAEFEKFVHYYKEKEPKQTFRSWIESKLFTK